MAAPPLLAPLAALLNRNLGASTPARQLLATLRGRSFALQVETPLGGRLLRLRLAAAPEGVEVSTGDEPADASVTGSPFGLALLLAGRSSGRHGTSGVTISGDAELAEAFETLLRHAQPDLEEELARLVGDTPAHYAARAAHGALEWARRAAASLARSTGEYLTEEGRDLVPAAELELLHAGIDALRDDVDRAEARLALAATRLGRQTRSA